MNTSVREARDLARRWVAEEGSRLPGFRGAYFVGSIKEISDDAALPSASDVDLIVVLAGGLEESGRTKFLYGGVLLEVTSLPLERVQTPEQVLGDYHLVGGFSTPGIIVDPSGHLHDLQQRVLRDYARQEWVQRRCEQARARVLDRLEAVRPQDPLHQRVLVWLFATGVTTHILLVAGLRNPTVRRRYAAVRELLAAHGRLDLHELLLDLIGCAHLTPVQVEEHLVGVTRSFDAAAAVPPGDFPFASDITPIARPIAVDGSRELIAQGLHREAMFWIAVTASRCQAILAEGAPAEAARFEGTYRALLADLGIDTFAAMQKRSERVTAALPHIWQAAEDLMPAG